MFLQQFNTKTGIRSGVTAATHHLWTIDMTGGLRELETFNYSVFLASFNPSDMVLMAVSAAEHRTNLKAFLLHVCSVCWNII